MSPSSGKLKDSEIDPEKQNNAKELKKSLEDIFKNTKIPQNKKEEMIQQISVVVEQSFSGSIPPSGILEQYNNINPDFSKPIGDMAIQEQKYAHSRDNIIINKSFTTKRFGQPCAVNLV
ncbi:hypothetical protein RCC89_15645 [Cytophagaceae bacterium ABcell3]|nr:hypothetical protein RCC89_15645 [Cytophagaceae bacterium ABcell3]